MFYQYFLKTNRPRVIANRNALLNVAARIDPRRESVKLFNFKNKMAPTSKLRYSNRSWNTILKSYLLHEDAYTEEIIVSTSEALIIKDKYPKSSIHWLVLPKRDDLDSVKDLTKEHIPLLSHMYSATKEALSLHYPNYFDKMLFGFHLSPSLRHLHMHVISNDFISDHLTKKVHYNSFNTPFFVLLSTIFEELSEFGSVNLTSLSDALLKSTLKCRFCNKPFASIPDIKKHLIFEADINK